MTPGAVVTTEGRRGFSSDNASGVHPEVLAAMLDANVGHVASYGGDNYTSTAEAMLREAFGAGTQAHLVLNGTGANVSSMAAVLQPHEAVVCSSDAHVLTDECGALQRFAGNAFLPVATEGGKLTSAAVAEVVARVVRGQHQSQPGLISITNATELGTVYSPSEVAALADWAHTHGMLLHVDGARLANAAASYDVSLAQLTSEAGADVVTFGGTKNGLVMGEAVVFSAAAVARPGAASYDRVRKQSMQLASKMRFVAAQFVALMSNDLWRRNAMGANNAAQQLARRIGKLDGVEIALPVEANSVFAQVPEAIVSVLADGHFGHLWDANSRTVRMVCSFDTQRADIDALMARARRGMVRGVESASQNTGEISARGHHPGS